MTDRYSYIVVGLSKDIREDDAEPILAAIRMIKGVLTVQPHVAEFGEVLAQERARIELRARVWDALRGSEQ